MLTNHIDNATSTQLLRLIDEGSSGESIAWDAEDLAAVWRQQLDAPLLVLLSDPDASLDRADVDTLEQLLVNPSPPAEFVQLLALWAKNCAATAQEAMPSEPARVLYFMLTWIGRYRCGGGLSALGDEALKAGLKWSERRDWIDPWTRTLLVEMQAGLG